MNFFDQTAKILDEAGKWRHGPRLVTLLYWAIGLFTAWQTRFLLTPDGFAYAQAARHYADGSLGLAVNSWWSPFLSWLTVPFIWAKVQPVLAMRLLSVAFGWLLARGVGTLVETITGGRDWFIAYALGLLAALIMVPRYLTPDLLLSCVIIWYLVLAARLLQSDSIKHALTIGLFGGMAYLVKAYALPYLLAHLLMTALLKISTAGRGAIKPCLKQYAAALVGLALVAGPWILVISRHEGRPTISSSARYQSLWMGTPDYKALPFKRLNFPREGRIWCWEDPTEVRGPFKFWSVFDGVNGVKKELHVIVENIRRLPASLNTADHFGLMTLGLGFTIVCLFPLREIMKTPREVLQLWGCLSALIYLGGYVPSVVDDRYLWPAWGILLALFTAGPAARGGGEAPVEGAAPAAWPSERCRFLSRFHAVFLAALTALLALSAANELRLLFKPDGDAKNAVVLKNIGDQMKAHTVFVSNKWRPGLYLSYWAGGRFLGELVGKTPDDIAKELAPFGEPTLVIFGDQELADALLNSASFTLLKTHGHRFWAFKPRLVTSRPL